MKRVIVSVMGIWTAALVTAWGVVEPAKEAPAKTAVYPTAILSFKETGAGAHDLGQKVSDVVFATLAANPALFLVDRSELSKTLQEHELNLSGMVAPDQAIKVGKITGAKVLVTGSVIDADKTLYLVAKIIGTETTRVLGATVKGKSSDDIGTLSEELAKQVADTILKQADQLVAKEVKMEDRIAAVKKALGDGKRPSVVVRVVERHVGQATIDPAAETEITLFCKEAGFDVIDPKAGDRKADVTILGEGFSEFGMRHGNLVSVKARVEIKAVDQKTDRILATDRETYVAVDLTEQIAGKTALQNAAAQIAERLLPKLMQKP